MKSIQEIFQERTIYKYGNKPVDNQLLQEIYDLMKLGPTSANSCPLRITFVTTKAKKELLSSVVMAGNVDKVDSAPATAIFAYDLEFYNMMDKTNPISPTMKEMFASSSELALSSAKLNSTLQATYFMIIARSKGLDCGPMSGFNEQALNDAFFKGTSYRVNFICNLGYRDGENPFPRLPRLEFDETCNII